MKTPLQAVNRKFRKRGAIAWLVLAVAAQAAFAQAPGQSVGSNGGSSEVGTAMQAQQQLAAPGPALNPSNSTSQSGISPSFNGSLVQGKATSGVLPLSIDDAIQRGLRNNLGLILQSSNERLAGGQRLT